MMTHYVDLPEGKSIRAFYSTEQQKSRPIQCYDEGGNIILATLVHPWQGAHVHLDHAVTCSATTEIVLTDDLSGQYVKPNTLYLVTGK